MINFMAHVYIRNSGIDNKIAEEKSGVLVFKNIMFSPVRLSTTG